MPGENKMSSRSHCQSGAGGKKKAGFIYLFVLFFFSVACSGRRTQRGIQNLEMYWLILVSRCWKSANNWLHRLRVSEREWRGRSGGGGGGWGGQTNAEMTI